MKRERSDWILVLGMLLLGCAPRTPSSPASHEDLDAALWMRTSAEYRVLSQVAFQGAINALERGLKDATWSALPTQADRLLAQAEDGTPSLPVAAIVDVDETVLDNSEYQVRQIEQQTGHEPNAWDAWVSEAAAPALPGAAEFLKACADAKVTVFFVTNRDVEQEQYTRRNLENLGLISPQVVDNILSKNERAAWTVDKSSRRETVADRYRILTVVGDDLNDFIWPGERASPAARSAMAAKYRNYWGQKWFLIPNANYGSWERSVYDYEDGLSRKDKIQRKLESLRESF